MPKLFEYEEAAALLSRVKNEVTRQMAEGAFSSPDKAARSLIKLETMFPNVQFQNKLDGVHFRVFLSEIRDLRQGVRFQK